MNEMRLESKQFGIVRLLLLFLLLGYVGRGTLCGQDRQAISHQEGQRAFAPKLQTTGLSVGGVILRDQYLSPLSYGGHVWGLERTTQRSAYRAERGDSSRWRRILGWGSRSIDESRLVQTEQSLRYALADNPAGNASIHMLWGSAGRQSLFRLYHGVGGRLFVGGGAHLDLGALYSTRNGNNPLSLKAMGNLSAHVLYTYRLPLEHFSILFRAGWDIDLLGLSFAQGFGESYYELFYVYKEVGKRFHLTYPSNRFASRLRLSADLPVGNRFTASLGYIWHYQNTKLNYNTFRTSEHAVSIGFSTYLNSRSDRKFVQDHALSIPF